MGDTWQEPLLYEDLKWLEELDIAKSGYGAVDTSPLSHLPRLKTLNIRDGNMEWIAERWYTQLSSLTLDCRGNHPVNLNTITAVYLPYLESLDVSGYWGFIKSIEAPNLEKLTLRGNALTPGIRSYGSVSTVPGVLLETMTSTTLRPRVLHIEKSIPEVALVKMLEVWKSVKVLQITCIDNASLGDTIGEVLTSELSLAPTAGKGGEGGKMICPNLRKLVVLAPAPTTSFKQDKGWKMDKLARKLEDIIDARKETGALEYVSCGLYPVDRDENLDDGKELWNTEWKRLL
jgi:hypothetical protein